MVPISAAHTGNRLLDALSADVFGALVPQLEQMPLPVRQVLYQVGEPIEFVHFPQCGMVSEVAVLDGGARVEVGVIGREGFVGIPALLGADTSAHEVFVQVAGTGLRMTVSGMRSAAERSPKLRALLLRSAQLFLIQVSRTAACNARHPIEARLARWLLMAHDRVGAGTADEIPLTHEFLAIMLGVQRPGVSLAAGALQAAGVIHYTHGRIAVSDREALEASSCGCHRSVREEYDRVFPVHLSRVPPRVARGAPRRSGAAARTTRG